MPMGKPSIVGWERLQRPAVIWLWPSVSASQLAEARERERERVKRRASKIASRLKRSMNASMSAESGVMADFEFKEGQKFLIAKDAGSWIYHIGDVLEVTKVTHQCVYSKVIVQGSKRSPALNWERHGPIEIWCRRLRNGVIVLQEDERVQGVRPAGTDNRSEGDRLYDFFFR